MPHNSWAPGSLPDLIGSMSQMFPNAVKGNIWFLFRIVARKCPVYKIILYSQKKHSKKDKRN